MSKQKIPKVYPPLEEKINTYSHIIGSFLGAAALVLLVMKSLEMNNPLAVLSFSIFGLSLITLYVASSIYHGAVSPVLRHRLKVFDHCAIYVLIAGTYAPYALVTLGGTGGWILFGSTWIMAIAGITLKLFFTGRFSTISTLLYVFMGWMIIFFIKPILAGMPAAGFYWLLAGGIAYTLGAVIYSINRISFNHAIFHIFVLLGSICHFVSIYRYV